MARLLLLFLALMTGCGTPCDASDLAAGAGTGRIDGASWTAASASWSEAGSAIQVTTADADGWRVTLVAAGVDADALDTGEEVDVDMGEGSFAALYPSEGDSYAANQTGSGGLTLWREGDNLVVCFSFTATDDDGATSAASGVLRAACSGDACG